MQEPRAMKMAELVRASETTRSTIHHYLNLGILPAPLKKGPKLHVFGAEHLEALRHIKQLRARGMSLQTIRHRLSDLAPRKHGAKVQPKKSGTRTAILAHAARLFVRDGYEGMRLDQLASELRVGKATIYRHFSSKEALFVECVDAMRFIVVPHAQRNRSEQKADAWEHGRDRAAAILEHFTVYRGLTSLLQTLTHHRDAALAQRARSALHSMITNAEPFLRKLRSRGEIRDVDTELLAYMLWGALLAAGDRLARDERYTREQVLAAYFDFAQRGLAVQQP